MDWKKNKPLVSHQILRDSLLRYQKAVKDAKVAYFSNIISRHLNSQINKLFQTIIVSFYPNTFTIPPFKT